MASENKGAAAQKLSATNSSAKDFKRESAAARFIGAGKFINQLLDSVYNINCRIGTAGLAELIIFHPVC